MKKINLEEALKLDKLDPLSRFKKYFVHTKNEIYLNGNSLGKLPKKTALAIHETVQNQWGKGLIRSWNKNWLDLSIQLEKKIASLLGTRNYEIKVGDSTSVNLYQIIHALLSSNSVTKNLLTDSLNFPSDIYVLEGLGSHFKIPKPLIVKYSGNISAEINLLKNEIKNNPGIVCLSLVTYKSSWVYPLKELNDFAAKHNSIIVWDLSHAVGVIDIDLIKTNTLLAVGCTYKFLNGGPGSPGFLYIHSSIQSKLNNPIQGWFGHQSPFLFDDSYIPASNVKKFASGTPGILSMVGMETGLDLTLDATIKLIRKKSISQSKFLISLIQREILSYGFSIESPLKSSERGSHITISHPKAWRICKKLQEGSSNFPKIISDFRPEKYIRLGIAPLYTSYEDLWKTTMHIREIAINKSYKTVEKIKQTLT